LVLSASPPAAATARSLGWVCTATAPGFGHKGVATRRRNNADHWLGVYSDGDPERDLDVRGIEQCARAFLGAPSRA